MRFRIAFALLISVTCASAHAAKAQIVVVQQRIQQFTDFDPNLDLLPVLASVLESTGLVSTVAWNESNPLITAAIADKQIKSFSDNPSHDDVFRFARAIRADFVIFCNARIEAGSVRGGVELFRGTGGRSIFKDENSVQIFIEGAIDKESSLLSIANTFATKLFAGPLKDFVRTTPLETPPPTGSIVTTTDLRPPDKTPFENGIRALESGRIAEAINLLRDAVDVDPRHGAARLALIEALRRAGKPFLAAEEALRGAELNPNDLSLVVAAADCWLVGGQPDRAKELVKQVLKTNPSSDAGWMVYGDICVSTVSYDDAIAAYSNAINIRPSAEAYYKRAQAYALQEKFDASNQDMNSAKQLGLDDSDQVKVLERYRSTIKVVDNVFMSLASSVRNILVERRTAQGPDIVRRARELAGRVHAFNEYVQKITPPESHKRSHDQRILALSLLTQSAVGMEKFASSGDTETHDEANLLQIEAMREYGAGQTLYQKEADRPS